MKPVGYIHVSKKFLTVRRFKSGTRKRGVNVVRLYTSLSNAQSSCPFAYKVLPIYAEQLPDIAPYEFIDYVSANTRK